MSTLFDLPRLLKPFLMEWSFEQLNNSPEKLNPSFNNMPSVSMLCCSAVATRRLINTISASWISSVHHSVFMLHICDTNSMKNWDLKKCFCLPPPFIKLNLGVFILCSSAAVWVFILFLLIWMMNCFLDSVQINSGLELDENALQLTKSKLKLAEMTEKRVQLSTGSSWV